MSNGKASVFNGIFADNTVLSSFMLISPVIVCGDTLRNAEALVFAFSAITFVSVILSSLVPKKLPYAIKIILYAVIASLVYVPVKMTAQQFFPGIITRIGIYFPLLAVNSLIVVQTEAKFFRMPKIRMILSLISYILGFDIVILIISFIRELLAYGTINSHMADTDFLISGLGIPCGGFVFLGLMCGIYRKIRTYINSNERSGKNVSDN